MANTSSSLPLYECIPLKYSIRRALELLILLLLISLLVYRLLRLKDYHDDDNDGVFIGFPWLLAFLCESWFTLIWLLTISTKWTPVDTKTYPDRLLQRYHELPPVDVFVTTADPVLEPPIITVNTVLSLLAVEYGANKLACYVSDDGCSPVTYYSLVEASKFAKLWVPFCKKYGIQVRAPFRYFDKYSDVPQAAGDPTAQFRQEWRKMKDNYGQLKGKIEAAPRELNSRALTGDFAVFSHVDRRNHPTIIKVILENKEGEAGGLELPHLVYVSREKRPKHHHHFKAGAMNVLTRVSAVMTNAPFMLNVDCDMFANNPLIILHAMCLLLGGRVVYGFVQSPQVFYDGLEDDPFGNQLIVLHKGLARGIAGIQGFFYAGTGCFHRRKVIYGLLPEDVVEQHDNLILENVLIMLACLWS